MKMRFLSTMSLAFALVAAAQAKAGQPTGDLILVQQDGAEGPGRMLDYQGVIRGLGANVRKTLAEGRIVVVSPPKNLTWQQYQTQLKASGMFSSVEPDTYVTPCGTVNDPLFPNQWHLHEISVQRAWDFTFGGNKIVAVVDGGVDLTHPDLMANLVPGYNVLTSQTQVSGGVVSDVRTNGHGTRIAGVAAAVGSNGIGVSGVGPNLKIMPVRVTNDAAQGIALRSDLLAGAQWAVQNGATAVNVSYTGVENADVEAMGAWIRTQGGFLVWAAGNANTHWDNFDHPSVTVVGGLDRPGNRWVSGLQGSGYGRGVDVWAPCVQIFTTSKGGGYGNAPAGTSFAVPQVAATLALIRDRRPSDSSALLEKKLLYRAFDLGSPGVDTSWSWGRLNVGRAVEDLARRYEFNPIPVPAGYSDSSPTSINDQGEVVGSATHTSTGQSRGWRYSVTDGFRWIDSPLAGHFFVPSKINNQGVVSGASHPLPYGPPIPAIVNASGLFIQYVQPASWPGTNSAGLFDMNSSGVGVGATYIWSTWGEAPRGYMWPNSNSSQYAGWQNFTRLFSVNDEGLAVGESYHPQDNTLGRAIIVDTNSLQSIGLTVWDPYRNDLKRIRNNGWAIGQSRSTWSSLQHAVVLRVGSAAYGLSYDQVSLYSQPSNGLDISSAGEAVGVYAGHGQIWNGLNSDRLANLLVNPLPLSLSGGISSVNGINNLGVVVGNAIESSPPNLRRAFLAKPTEAYGAAVSLGQLGESPTYIGSIPPALSVTFVNEAGTPYPNATTNLTYVGVTGRLNLSTPASVTGPFRLYMRCNSAVIPNYQGPTFLSKMYPPLNEPAAPVDAGFLPFDGPLVGGTPTIIMYAGDVDNSGEIDAADIDVVIANFGLVNGDTGWDYAVDVDGTGEIDAADIDLVIANFGLTGDPEP